MIRFNQDGRPIALGTTQKAIIHEVTLTHKDSDRTPVVSFCLLEDESTSIDMNYQGERIRVTEDPAIDITARGSLKSELTIGWGVRLERLPSDRYTIYTYRASIPINIEAITDEEYRNHLGSEQIASLVKPAFVKG